MSPVSGQGGGRQGEQPSSPQPVGLCESTAAAKSLGLCTWHSNSKKHCGLCKGTACMFLEVGRVVDGMVSTATAHSLGPCV
jgi:hypothetical protein